MVEQLWWAPSVQPRSTHHNSTDQTWDAGKCMRAAELALDCSCLLLLRTVSTSVTVMQNLSDFICSPTEDHGDSTQAENQKRATENSAFLDYGSSTFQPS